MKFVLYSKYAYGGGPVTQRLTRQIKQMGHQATTISNLAEAEVELNSSTDVFIAQLTHQTYKLAFKLTELFAQSGAYTPIPSQAVLDCFDKYRSYLVLRQHNIPTPPTWLCQANQELQLPEQLPYPLIIKPTTENQGRGIEIVKDLPGLIAALHQIHKQYKQVIVQTYIVESTGVDIRAFVIGDRVVAAMQRQGSAGSYIANLSQGGVAKSIELTIQEQNLAVATARAMDILIAGVDIIRSDKGPLVIEVNASPGLHIEDVTGVPITKFIVEELVRRISA